MRKWTETLTISIVMYMSQTAAWPVDRFRATLDRILDETGLSQAGLAALVPMNQSQLSRWKGGSSRPKFDTLRVLGEKLRSAYPTLMVGPNELLESAGYSPPEPVIRSSEQESGEVEVSGSGARVKHFDARHLQLEVTVDRERTPEEILGPITLNERALMVSLEAQGKPRETIVGAVLLVRMIDAQRSGQVSEETRKKA